MGKVHASLFSGFGAGDLAATWMGWNNAFWCEIDGFCQTVLQYWFPKSIGYGNIKETDFTAWRGKIDILTGGFPCQPFSVAGQRKGAYDDRYLWPEMLRAIREIQPTWVIGENVGGIVSMVQPGSEVTVESQASLFEASDKETLLEQEYVVETVCRNLEQEGYSVQPVVIPACAVGAPHRRDRIFFIAYRADAGIEGLQREGKDGVCRSEITPNSSSIGSNCWSTNSNRVSKNKKERTRVFFKTYGFSSKRIVTDSDGIRCDNRGDYWQERPIYYDWKRYSEKDQSERDKRKYRTCENGSATSDTQCQGSGQVQQEIQSEQSDGNSINSISHEWHVADTDNKRLQGCVNTGSIRKKKKKSSYEQFSRLLLTNWQNFPTQPPICRGNDGLPFNVVHLTIPFNKWREGSVKGYGNAIVPQVIFEIYKAIEEVEQLE